MLNGMKRIYFFLNFSLFEGNEAGYTFNLIFLHKIRKKRGVQFVIIFLACHCLHCKEHFFCKLTCTAKRRVYKYSCLLQVCDCLDLCFNNVDNSSLLSSDEEEWMHHDTSAKQGCGQFRGRGRRYLSIGSVYVNMLGMRQLSG